MKIPCAALCAFLIALASCQTAPEINGGKNIPASVTPLGGETARPSADAPLPADNGGPAAAKIENGDAAETERAPIKSKSDATMENLAVPDLNKAGRNPDRIAQAPASGESKQKSAAENPSWKNRIFGAAESGGAAKTSSEPGAQFSEQKDAGRESARGEGAGAAAAGIDKNLVSSPETAGLPADSQDAPPASKTGNASLTAPESCEASLNETCEKFLKAVEKNPGDEKLKRDAAIICALLGEVKKARELLSDDERGERRPVEDRLSEIQVAFKSGDSDNAIELMRSLAEDLRTKAPLKVQNLAFCDRIDGFGLYTERSSNAFDRSGYILLYFEIENFVDASAGDKRYAAGFIVEYKVTDSSGAVRYERKDFGEVKHETRTRIRDLNLTLTDQLPGNLATGEYKLELFVTDQNKAYHRKASAAISFTIR
jgi:hypothetical protein